MSDKKPGLVEAVEGAAWCLGMAAAATGKIATLRAAEQLSEALKAHQARPVVAWGCLNCAWSAMRDGRDRTSVDAQEWHDRQLNGCRATVRALYEAE